MLSKVTWIACSNGMGMKIGIIIGIERTTDSDLVATSFSMTISAPGCSIFCALDNRVTFALLIFVMLGGATLTKKVLNPSGGIVG